jgi:hypothetical protein
MKKIFLVGTLIIILSLFFLINDSALAQRHSRHYHFGIFIAPPVIAPPVIFWAPAPPYYYPPSYPPPPYYREWVPGHWEWQWDPYWGCWRRVWVPGYWRWEYDDP